ncbi:GAF domain-containing protein [Streptomyces exfoliatus]|uniref:GAF domain-containing protein n=1 Tax=Streptomyces exfoliatus TaxID=1905 RepID=A0ABV3D3B1_STREX
MTAVRRPAPGLTWGHRPVHRLRPGRADGRPLVHGDRVLGVLEVLDPSPQARSSLTELDLLCLFARQAAVALHVLTTHTRRAPAPDASADPSRTELLRLLSEARRLLGE